MATEIKAKLGLDSSAFTAGLDAARDSLSSFGGSLAGALSVAGVIEFGKKMLEAAGDIEHMAAKTGLSTTDVQRFGFAAEVSGASSESLAKAMVRLERNTQAAQQAAKGAGDTLRIMGEDGEIVAHSGSKAADAIRKLGLNASEFFAMNPGDRLLAISEGFKRTGDVGAVFDLLGKGATELLPLLRMNREELERLLSVGTVDSGTINALHQTEIALKQTKQELSTMALQAAGKVNSLLREEANAMAYYALQAEAFWVTLREGKKVGDEFRAAGLAALFAGMKPPAADANKPAAFKPVEGGLTDAQLTHLGILSEQNEKLRERIALIGKSTEEEITYLVAKKDQNEAMQEGETDTIKRTALIREGLELELQIAQLKKRQADEQTRSEERLAKLKRDGLLASLDAAGKIAAIDRERAELAEQIEGTTDKAAKLKLQIEDQELANERGRIFDEMNRPGRLGANLNAMAGDQFSRMGLFSGTGGPSGMFDQARRTAEYTSQMARILAQGIRVTELPPMRALAG